jgi:hypothetical protein
MASSRYAETTTTLLTALRASTALAALDTFIGDGPAVDDEYPRRAIYVGWSGDGEDDVAGSSSQEWHDNGPGAARDEIITLTCVARAQTGDNDLPGMRDAALDLLAEVESILRADVDLGIAEVMHAEVAGFTVHQFSGEDGVGVDVVFTIRFKALI